jgi:hypothetical protein
MKTILTNCTVIDCTGQPPLENTTVHQEAEAGLEGGEDGRDPGARRVDRLVGAAFLLIKGSYYWF